MSKWSCLSPISASMPYQMALDEILFRNMQEGLLPDQPIIRFYYSDGPWVTVGYSHPEKELSQYERICKRITGGGVVEHGSDLIFSLIAKKNHDESFGTVRVSYWKIHEAVKKGFELQGENPFFYRCDENLPIGAECFQYPIASDLGMGKQKIAGGSQKRSAGTLLHQESIQPPKNIDLVDLQKAILQGFETIFETKVVECSLNPSWLEQAKSLSREKYERA